MGILDFFRPASAAAPSTVSGIGTSVNAYSLDDPRLIEFLRLGEEAITGQTVSVEKALRNPSMFRAWSLISNSIGMLPTHLIDAETKKKASDHPLDRILHRRPNDFQTAYDFKSLLQGRALAKGDGYGLIIRSANLARRGKSEIAKIVPLDPDYVTPILAADWTVSYKYQPKTGGERKLRSDEVFHLRGLSLDGIKGISLIKQARDAIAIALSAQLATGRQFKNGSFVGGSLKHPAKISGDAYDRLKASLSEKEGAENAGKNLILEEGMTYDRYGTSARDAQLTELLKLQVEEIARVTGVPRPLLMVDETSWGSGIEALGQFFVAYALNPWFEAWQQAAERSLLTEEEQGKYAVKFNPGALLRGSMKDQADFLAKALGAGGHAPWMHVDEVRHVMDLPEREAPPHTMMGHNGGPALDDDSASKKPRPNKKQEPDDDDDE